MPYIEEEADGNIKFHWWHFIWTFVIVFVVLYALGWVALGEEVMTAGIRGQAGAYVQKESVPNRIGSQARFVTDLTDIVKFDQQYNDALKRLADWDKANAGKTDNALGTLANQRRDLDATAQGIQQQCQNTIADYNAAGLQYLSRDFKSEGLPDSVGIKDFCQGKPVSTYPGLQSLGLQ